MKSVRFGRRVGFLCLSISAPVEVQERREKRSLEEAPMDQSESAGWNGQTERLYALGFAVDDGLRPKTTKKGRGQGTTEKSDDRREHREKTRRDGRNR